MVKVDLSYNGDDGKEYRENLDLEVIPRVDETIRIKTAVINRLFNVTGVHHECDASGNNHVVTVFAEKQ